MRHLPPPPQCQGDRYIPLSSALVSRLCVLVFWCLAHPLPSMLSGKGARAGLRGVALVASVFTSQAAGLSWEESHSSQDGCFFVYLKKSFGDKVGGEGLTSHGFGERHGPWEGGVTGTQTWGVETQGCSMYMGGGRRPGRHIRPVRGPEHLMGPSCSVGPAGLGLSSAGHMGGIWPVKEGALQSPAAQN